MATKPIKSLELHYTNAQDTLLYVVILSWVVQKPINAYPRLKN